MSARVLGRGGPYRLRYCYEPAAADPDAERVSLRHDLSSALAFVRRLGVESTTLVALRRLLACERPGDVHLTDEDVIGGIARGLSSGRLIAYRVRPTVLASFDLPASEPETKEPEVKRSTVKTWIEIELLDTAGTPVPNELYWVELPDGRVREGRLDSNGRAYFGELDPGTCTVRFPNLDDDAIASPKPKLPPPEPVPKPKTWIEILLVDDEGRPIGGERFRVALPDGDVREGRLDGGGKARVEDIDPGNCLVSFPGLEEGSHERL